MQTSSFLLCLASPVCRVMLCGNFSESQASSRAKELSLNDVDMTTFTKALDMWCGRKDCEEMDVGEVRQLAIVADQFRMTEVVSLLEEALIGQLSVDMCGEVLVWSGRCGMPQLEAKALTMAAERFDEFSKTPGFMLMEEQALERVVDDDRLAARNEEAVWEAVVQWRCAEECPMKGEVEATQGCGVVSKIRFPLMEEDYLRRMVGMAPAEEAEWMGRVVEEALRAKAARREGAAFEFELLGRKALVDRVKLYREGEERLLLNGHMYNVHAFAECDGRVCSGSSDIRVWNKASGELERALQAAADEEESDRDFDSVLALAVWEGRLISSHGSGKLRVWIVATGECNQVIEGHDDNVWALAVCGTRLVSACEDESIKVWTMTANAPWPCEWDLDGHTSVVCSLTGWQDKVAGGSDDGKIWVWDVGTGGHDATLHGHTAAVWGLAVHGDRLFSAARDGTIREWALGTWTGLRTVQAYAPGVETWNFQCLAVSGSKLVSGSWARTFGGAQERRRTGELEGEVLVWGLEELDLQQTLHQPVGCGGVHALMATGGELWVGAGKEVVVWGRKP